MSDIKNPSGRLPISIEEELKRSYLDYAMSVIIGRALPDVRDGLKPVHRRILYGMWEGGNLAGKPYKKSARIVGDVMGKYHPHGDSAIYDTAVRMAQPFSMRYTLVDGQGNFGSIDGDSPAAMRYTEIRLTRLAHEMLGDDIAKDTVDWAPNYDGSLIEPTVLPAAYPNLLVNGSAGIAVGMATNIPPHNLSEIINAAIAVCRNPEISFEELLEIVPGPDFPTAGFIFGRRGIVDAYRTGRGRVLMRARARIEEAGAKKRARIIVEELPYQVNKANLVEKIAALVQAKKLEGIADLRDESDRDGIRIVIELKRDAIPEVVLNHLYKSTQMQNSFGIILLAVLNNQPKVFTLRELLQHFIDHRKEIIVRRCRFDLKKAKERAHILEGLVKALDQLDAVIRLIRNAADPATAKAGLIENFELSAIQAQAILDMKLQRLTGLEREKIIAEYEALLQTIEGLEEILRTPALVENIVIEEMEQVRDRFGDERRTEIVDNYADIEMEDLIAEEDMVITVTRGGYIKRTALSEYRSQRRGGRGRMGMATKDEDELWKLFVGSTHATLLFFTNTGRVFSRKVYQLPEVAPNARGRAMINLLALEEDEQIETLLVVRDFDTEQETNLFFATRRGRIKRTRLSEYANIRTTGLRAVSINEGDALLNVHLTDGDHHIFMGTRRGQAIRFHETDARLMGRTAAGVRGISLRGDDQVVEMASFPADSEADILVVTDRGYGKRSALEEFRIQQRGGKGIRLIQLTEKTGVVAGVRCVTEADHIMLVTEKGILIRTAAEEIRRAGRATQGVRVIRLGEGDRVVSVAKIEDADDEELEAGMEEDESTEEQEQD